MTWAAALRQHARLHTPEALGLGFALLGVLALLLPGLEAGAEILGSKGLGTAAAARRI